MQILLLSLLIVVIYISTIYSSSIDADYAVVIDAGSTGSRGFIYQLFIDDNGTRKIIGTKGKKVTPGLSSFADNPNDTVSYILPILYDSLSLIPIEKHSKIQLYIKGTAGMRLISIEKQNNIWNELVNGLNNHHDIPFNVLLSNLATIDGHAEAYYAVLSSNYIAGSIDGNLKRVSNVDMVGALDMGGSSTQLIFHTDTNPNEPVKDEDFWSHSWLNYGVEVIRDKIHDHLINKYENDIITNNGQISDNVILMNPCTFKGHEHIRDQYIMRGTGDGIHCVETIKTLVWSNYYDKCQEGKPCSVDDIKHPEIKGQFYGMSVYFYALDCIRQLGPETLHNWPKPTINELETAAHKFCETEWSIVETTMIPSPHKYTRDDQIVNRCLEGLYLVTLLEHGFGFDGDARDITLALEIEGHEVEWTLGFALAEVPLPLTKKVIDNPNNNPIKIITQAFKNFHLSIINGFKKVFDTIKSIILSIFYVSK